MTRHAKPCTAMIRHYRFNDITVSLGERGNATIHDAEVHSTEGADYDRATWDDDDTDLTDAEIDEFGERIYEAIWDEYNNR